MNENLISIAQTMSSLQIAELTGKRHDAILRDIRNLLEQGVQAHNFVELFSIRQLPNGGSKQEPYYQLTKKGCLILASGYNAKLREKIIDRWEELETEKQNSGFLVPQSFSEALMLAANQAKQIEELSQSNASKQETIEQQNATIKEQAPKVSYYDETLQSVNTLTTTQIAKELGLDAPKLNQRLKQAGVIFRQSGMWMLRQPYSSWNMTATRTQTYTRSDGSTGTSIYTVWNERGRRFIHALHESEYKPNIAKKIIAGKGGAA